jgi:hypothetical protein
LIRNSEGRTEIEGVREQGAEENIWTQREKVTKGWSKQCKKEKHNLYSSQNVGSIIISRRMR